MSTSAQTMAPAEGGGSLTEHPPLRRGRFRRAVDALTRVMALLSVACIVAMLLATVADVVRRTWWGSSIQGVTELGEVAMVAIVFLGLGYAQSRRGHVAMTLVVRRLSPRRAALVNGAGLLLVTAVVGWMLVVTTDRAIASYEISEYRFGLVQIPIWPARIAIAVGVAAYLLELLFTLWDDLQVLRGAVAPTHPAHANGEI